MKLYATTTSERASKGQGGNEYLFIDIFTTSKKEPTHKVWITPEEDGTIEIKLLGHHFNKWSCLGKDTIYTNKGKKQKSKFICDICGFEFTDGRKITDGTHICKNNIER